MKYFVYFAILKFNNTKNNKQVEKSLMFTLHPFKYITIYFHIFKYIKQYTHTQYVHTLYNQTISLILFNQIRHYINFAFH